MKTFQSLFCALFLGVLSCAAFAQSRSLPAGLTEKSSLEEIINWLDKTSFAEARIGLISDAPGLSADEIPTSVTRYAEDATFAKGFKLVKSEGCRLVLRNEDIKLLEFGTKYPDSRLGSLANFRKAGSATSFSGDLVISLDLLSKKGKVPFQHTKKTERADVFGLWRTEFKGSDKISITKFNKWRVPNQEVKILKDFELKIKASRAGDDESMDGDKLTFTFDDKETSEKFFAVFSRAVDLCRQN